MNPFSHRIDFGEFEEVALQRPCCFQWAKNCLIHSALWASVCPYLNFQRSRLFFLTSRNFSKIYYRMSDNFWTVYLFSLTMSGKTMIFTRFKGSIYSQRMSLVFSIVRKYPCYIHLWKTCLTINAFRKDTTQFSTSTFRIPHFPT